MNSHHKIIILDNVAILLSLFTYLLILIVIQSYHSYTDLAG